MRKALITGIIAVGIAILSTGATNATDLTPIPSPRFVEENLIGDAEVQPLVGLHEGLTWQAASAKHYLEVVHAAEVAKAKAAAAAKKKAAQKSAQVTGNEFSQPAPSGDFYYRLATCEGGGVVKNWNTGNGYYGYFQFMVSTWQNNGGTGYPHEHSYETQRAVAARNITPGNFSGQHPHCSKVMRAEGWAVPID